ncbi:MAG: phosphatase PAP2 family protein [Lachnospiraceae bacterium]|nr:phosphatase PAP2 family protein [Lachnospiraceae bacterium]
MDINILLALQEFRNGAGECLAEYMSKMTFFGETSTVLVIIAIIYWCVSKEAGQYFLMGMCGNRILNGFLKVTACVYRPWIRDARIVPYGDSMETATGYSFPSGHSTNAATLFGGGAIKKELPRILRVFLAVIFVLIAFSRIFLGVHTPQDILVGSLLGLLVMWLVSKLMQWIEVHPDKDIVVMLTGIGIAVAVAIYAFLKPYPEDFDAAGELLVDGAKMIKDTYKVVGLCIGGLTGWVLERRVVGFSTDVPMMTRITRLVTGLFGYYVVNYILAFFLKEWIPGAGGNLASNFLKMFYISFIFPWVIMRVEGEVNGDGSP